MKKKEDSLFKWTITLLLIIIAIISLAKGYISVAITLAILPLLYCYLNKKDNK